MANLNRIILVGTVLQNPEVRLTVDGRPVGKFQLGVSRWARPGVNPESDIIDIVAWEKLAEVCGQHLKKNKTVLVEGRIQNRSFNDETGQKKWVTEVIARSLQLLGGEAAPIVTSEEETADTELFTGGEDLPF